MKKIVVSKMGMYRSVMQYLDSRTEWNGLPAFELAYQQVITRYHELKGLALDQVTVLSGVGSAKRLKREQLAILTMDVVGALKAVSSVLKDSTLKEKMKISLSGLKFGKEIQALNQVDIVIEEAGTHIAILGDYGIDQSKLDELIQLKTEMEAIITAPRRAVIDRKVINAKISSLVHEIDRILKEQLDTLMIQFKGSALDFYTGYSSARIIIDVRGKAQSADLTSPGEPDPPVDDGI